MTKFTAGVARTRACVLVTGGGAIASDVVSGVAEEARTLRVFLGFGLPRFGADTRLS